MTYSVDLNYHIKVNYPGKVYESYHTGFPFHASHSYLGMDQSVPILKSICFRLRARYHTECNIGLCSSKVNMHLSLFLDANKKIIFE